MKKVLVLLMTFFAVNSTVEAQYVTIPDPGFRDYLMQRYPTCFNASSMLDTTCSSIVNETHISISTYPGVTNWDGFQYLKNLKFADFGGIFITSLPNLPATLDTLSMSDVPVTTMPDLPNGLLYLRLYSTNITSLPALPNSLKYMSVSNNGNLQFITALPSSLRHFDCQYTPLTSIPALPSSLTYLDCQETYITSLPALPNALDTLLGSNCTLLTSLPALPASLKYFDCNHSSLTTLPALSTSLIHFDCSYNNIADLPSLPALLQYLNITNNHISSIPALPTTLKSLFAGYNAGLTSLPTLPAGLENLDVGNTSINSLPILSAGLKAFGCDNNNITSMPSLPAGLISLSCNFNQLTTLPALPLTLTILGCGNNLLTNLPSLPNTINSVTCSNNQLTSLPVLPHNLVSLICSYNQLYFLPPLPDTLQVLDCIRNNITCLPVLPSGNNSPVNLQIYIDNKIACVPNETLFCDFIVIDSATLGTTYYYNGSYELCSAVNNVHHCDAFPLMTGYVYNDNNNNLVKDANEPFRANVRVQLPNGVFTMTNSNGYYQIPSDSIDNYSITATAPNFFAAVPAQYNYNFSSYDTLVRGDFALQATTTVDSLTISVLPINFAARPGFAYPYLISYQNVGTTTLSPNIVFNYDNTRLTYDSSSNVSVTNSGSALSLAEPGFVAGMQKSYVAYFTVNPSAVIGDSIRAHVSINTAAATAMDSTIAEIRGSFDPNDKSATPALSPSQVVNGNYIYYTIRFQNTGTDTAFNVVITDTLNSQLQAATLQVINTSHPAKITVTGNAVSFEFLNILLPDSNVNELKSHGYVTFRIKPQPTVVLNDIIPNKAAIYFDYNSPVLTNTAVTNIMEPVSPVPLKLLSFNVVRSNGNNANAFWNTSNEINVQSYNIEMSIDGRIFSNISYEKAKGYQYNDYTKTIAIPSNDILYFRLKMIDVDGRFTYSPIVTLRNDKSQSFSFLNNPVKNELNISVQDDALKNTMAKIYNAQGLLVKTILLQRDVETLNVRSLPAGTYYLVTEKGSKQFVVLR